jgi:hypothetical protein
MEHPISYAMRNAPAVESLIFFNAPAALLDWSFLAIEWLVFISCGLGLWHALRERKRTGNPAALYTFLAIFLYGLLIDIVSYYTVENFWHGEFSVMFLHNRLPLYIALFYPAFLYPVFMTVKRYALAPISAAIVTGFFAGTAYQIFDNLGPLLGWWVWDRNTPTSWPMLDSVPLTSYHWMFVFTIAFAYIAQRFFWAPAAQQSGTGRVALKLLSIPVLTCVLGSLIFVPYNILAYTVSLGSAAFFHAIVFGGAALLFILNFQSPTEPRDRLLMSIPLIWVIGHLFLYIAKWHLFWQIGADGASQAANYTNGLYASNLIAACAGMAAAFTITVLAHPSKAKR